MRRLAAIVITALTVVFCSQPAQKAAVSDYIPPVPVPEDNQVTPEKVALGRHLFYEKAISEDSSVSCASCHIQRYAFTDTARVSVGFKGDKGFRNSSTLANVAYLNLLFREGGVTTLERAVHPPVMTEFEMNINTAEMVDRLRKNPKYIKLFDAAFGAEPDYKGVVQALASFQRTLLSFNSPYDRFMQGDSTAMSPSAVSGLKLFRSERLNCTSCHVEPLFLDEKFHNIGLYQAYEDFGRGRFTLDSADYGKMITPTLRNIAVTWPYMHDGSMQTLEQVITFYQTGGEAHPNKSNDMKAFVLTEQERIDLLAFLNALTDSTFISDSTFSAPP